jgi:hypothetical protein
VYEKSHTTKEVHDEDNHHMLALAISVIQRFEQCRLSFGVADGGLASLQDHLPARPSVLGASLSIVITWAGISRRCRL